MNSNRRYECTTDNEIAVFRDPFTRRLLLHCIAEARTASSLREEMESSMNRTHYALRKLLAIGLIIIEREASRAGRAIKYYRAIADCFVISSDRLGLANSSLWNELQSNLEKHQSEWPDTVAFGTNQEGKPSQRRIASEKRDQKATEMWEISYLTTAQAKQLEADLRAVLAPYRNSTKNNRNSQWLIHTAICKRDI